MYRMSRGEPVQTQVVRLVCCSRLRRLGSFFILRLCRERNHSGFADRAARAGRRRRWFLTQRAQGAQRVWLAAERSFDLTLTERRIEEECVQRDYRPSLGLLPQFPGKVVEDAQLIAVEIGDAEFAQVPRLVFRRSKDPGAGVAPAKVQFIDLLLAIQIQPDHDRPESAVLLAERRIGQEHAAVALGDAADAAVVIAPVELEPEHADVILGGFVDIADRNLRNGAGKLREHGGEVTRNQRRCFTAKVATGAKGAENAERAEDDILQEVSGWQLGIGS